MQSLGEQLATAITGSTTLPDWQVALLTVGVSLAVAAVVHVGGDIVVKRVTTRIPGEVDDILLARAHTAIWSSIGLAGLYLGALQLSSVPAGVLDATNATTLTAITLIWAWTLIRASGEVLDAVTESNYLDRQVVPILQNIWTAVVVAIALFLTLSFWEVNVTPLLASAGVAGIVVGLAARDAIANFFGSLALYADGTYTIGDYVVLESGERGRVEDISIRSTVIRTRDDVLVTIPNATLNNSAIVNESDPKGFRRLTVPVGVAYGTDPEVVDDVLLTVAGDSDSVREQPTPRVFLTEFGASAINFELWCWIDHPRLRERVQDELLREIYTGLREADVEIPFPQRDVNLPEEVADGVADSAADVGQAPPPAEADSDGSKGN
jgi:small-conductance mechanosensitive channel